jgi:hypothetical protein
MHKKSYTTQPSSIYSRYAKLDQDLKMKQCWGQGGEMNQALYAHMNNKIKMKNK